jgi:hypothetical protein
MINLSFRAMKISLAAITFFSVAMSMATLRIEAMSYNNSPDDPVFSSKIGPYILHEDGTSGILDKNHFIYANSLFDAFMVIPNVIMLLGFKKSSIQESVRLFIDNKMYVEEANLKLVCMATALIVNTGLILVYRLALSDNDLINRIFGN